MDIIISLAREIDDQVQNIMFGDAKHVIDFGRTSFGMEALHWTAVQVNLNFQQKNQNWEKSDAICRQFTVSFTRQRTLG